MKKLLKILKKVLDIHKISAIILSVRNTENMEGNKMTKEERDTIIYNAMESEMNPSEFNKLLSSLKEKQGIQK